MNVYDLFRGFFGVPGRRDPFFAGITREEDNDDEDDGEEFQDYPFGSRPPEGFGFGPGGSLFEGSLGFDELFRDFNKLFTDVDAWMASPLELPSAGERPRERGRSLRDSMLKDPDSDCPGSSEDSLRAEAEAKDIPGFISPERRPPWRPFSGIEDLWKVHPRTGRDDVREDKDLDSQVSSEGLDTVLRPSEPQTRSFFKSVSVTKVTGPDGTVEEHRTVKDSQGKTETTVSRRKGDQMFVSTTVKNEQGKEEVSEKMVNLEDRDLEQFTGGWKLKEGAGTDLKDTSSILDMFLRRWFSSR